MRSVVAFLLLGLAWPAARASLDMSKYILDATACDESSPGLTSIPYGTFGLYRGPLRAVQVDNATNELIITYPADNAGGDLVYKLEGVRLNYSICSYCPYSAWPEAQYPEYIPSSGIRNVPAPMYGPCFDGQASTVNRMSCVQNLALYPPDFCGEYFYPDQTLDAWVRWQNAWNPFFYHSYIEGSQSATDIQNEIGPTYYGLGKGNVQNYLQSYVVRNVTSGQTVAAATQALQAPYQTDAQGVERWPKFAQHFCCWPRCAPAIMRACRSAFILVEWTQPPISSPRSFAACVALPCTTPRISGAHGIRVSKTMIPTSPMTRAASSSRIRIAFRGLAPCPS